MHDDTPREKRETRYRPGAPRPCAPISRAGAATAARLPFNDAERASFVRSPPADYTTGTRVDPAGRTTILVLRAHQADEHGREQRENERMQECHEQLEHHDAGRKRRSADADDVT